MFSASFSALAGRGLFWCQRAQQICAVRIILNALHSAEIRLALAAGGFSYPADFTAFESLQRIELSPELLVFRDVIKRSKFLDIWFHMVVNCLYL